MLFFNYRGSWGSPGDFSFTHSTEDVASALAYLREPANATQGSAPIPRKIVLIGHSMGGFMAAYGGSHDPGVSAIAMISGADFGTGNMAAHPEVSEDKVVSSLLRLTSPPRAWRRSAVALPRAWPTKSTAIAMSWNFGKLAPGIGSRPILILTSDDGLAPAADALGESLRKAGNKRVTDQHFATDHVYSGQRIALQQAVLAWLVTLP